MVQSVIILVEHDAATRRNLSERLRAQGYDVVATGDAAEAASRALAAPPAAVVADLWMPEISGIQLCRLLRSEASTADVPIILRAIGDDPRARFFAEKAGASNYVPKGRMGHLVRALSRSIARQDNGDVFFTHFDDAVIDIRERIAQHLDRALFESMLTSEVRALATADSFERLFDLFSQFMSQICRYRWLALYGGQPAKLGVHVHPNMRDQAGAEVRKVFPDAPREGFDVVDEDACDAEAKEPIVADVRFGGTSLGRIALAPCGDVHEADNLLTLVASELGGPLRIAELVQTSQRLASHDPLTGIMNRRAFAVAANARSEELPHAGLRHALLLLDVDHFKAVNDSHGHAAGDTVLSAMGSLLSGAVRDDDFVARWGGEEFVIALGVKEASVAESFAERIRKAIEALVIPSPTGGTIPVSASIGVALSRPGEGLDELVDRADKAMYEAKAGGRNRVVVASDLDQSAAA